MPILGWEAEQCRECWSRGTALLPAAPPSFAPEMLEPLLGALLDELAQLGPEEAEAVERFAEAWDAGRLSTRELLLGPAIQGRRCVEQLVGISADLVSLVTYLALRPALEAYLSPGATAFSPGLWDAGVCPLCGAPPSFADIGDDGQRWLACALCGGRWTIGRLRCPFCDNRDARSLTRLAAEGEEEGYLIEACEACGGYLKGVDRRLRWQAGPALVEDWGTPHLDLIARRKGYWRATPSLIQLAPAQD